MLGLTSLFDLFGVGGRVDELVVLMFVWRYCGFTVVLRLFVVCVLVVFGVFPSVGVWLACWLCW